LIESNDIGRLAPYATDLRRNILDHDIGFYENQIGKIDKRIQHLEGVLSRTESAAGGAAISKGLENARMQRQEYVTKYQTAKKERDAL
jgi:hypothetical protein